MGARKLRPTHSGDLSHVPCHGPFLDRFVVAIFEGALGHSAPYHLHT